MRHSTTIAPLLCALLLGCAGDSEEVRNCDVTPIIGKTFALPQAEGDRSFQGHIAFDGQQLWLTHAIAPFEGETIEVRAQRFSCEGESTREAIVMEKQPGLQTEPRIAAHGDKVMIAWANDSQAGQPNLSTHFKVFDREEGPESAPSTHLDTQYKGASVGNTWMPELSASKSGFVVAGLRGVSDFNSFQAFAQRVNDEGELDGDAIDPELTDQVAQEYATASLRDDGSMLLAWKRTDSTTGAEDIVHVEVPANSSTPSSAPVLVGEGAGSMPMHGGNEEVGEYLVFTNADGEIGIKSADLLNAEAPYLTLRETGGSAIYPRVAAGQNAGAAVWMEPTGNSFDAAIHVQGFSGHGFSMEEVGDEIVIETDNPAIGAYRPEIAHIQDSIYAVVWTEGPTSDLQIKWQLIDLQAK